MQITKGNHSHLLAIIFPILFCIIAGVINIPGWEIWGDRPLANTAIGKFLGYLLMPFGMVGFFMMIATMPLVIALDSLPIIGNFFFQQFPYLLFALFLLIRYRNKDRHTRWKASLIGTVSVYLVVLFVMLDAKGSTDGQTGIEIGIGLNAAFLVAIVVTEIINFLYRRSKGRHL